MRPTAAACGVCALRALVLTLFFFILHRANLQYSSLQRKLSSDLAVEKATAKRVEVEVASLEKSVHQMVSVMLAMYMCSVLFDYGMFISAR